MNQDGTYGNVVRVRTLAILLVFEEAVLFADVVWEVRYPETIVFGEAEIDLSAFVDTIVQVRFIYTYGRRARKLDVAQNQESLATSCVVSAICDRTTTFQRR